MPTNSLIRLAQRIDPKWRDVKQLNADVIKYARLTRLQLKLNFGNYSPLST